MIPQFDNARSVNPEAGDHPIGADPAERAAAESATRRSWREFPYYPKRYGERGWRFSLSDSGWLETLCHLTRAEACAQAKWLAGLLGARGMPHYLLERHLDYLHNELVRSAPARAPHYEMLQACVTFLRETRQAQIPEVAFQSLATRFEQAVTGCEARVPNMGVVIVAAVADERSGSARAVDSVEEWACDSARFDEVWIRAVRETIAAARSHSS